MAKTPKVSDQEFQFVEVNQATIYFPLLGYTPVILNPMGNKGVEAVWMPKGKKTSAEKASSLKHDPVAEFRHSAHILDDPTAPTLLGIRAVAFKRAICGAALDIPGAKKSQLGRLVQVSGEYLPIYGVPSMHIEVVRSADINHTPDVRTRCAIRRWAALVPVTFIKPILNERIIGNMTAAAGLIQGVGDWRVEKGSGDYGQWRIVPEDNPEFREILATGGRQEQIVGMDVAEPYDHLCGQMWAWFRDEADRRGLKITLPGGHATAKASST